jgi:hypothetical protein
MGPGTHSSLIKNMVSSWKRHRIKSVVSDLFMYVLLYLGDENTGIITGKNNLYVSSHVLNMLISDQFEQVWTFGCGNITEHTEIDFLIHTCVQK